MSYVQCLNIWNLAFLTTGWLGVKHRLTYLLAFLTVSRAQSSQSQSDSNSRRNAALSHDTTAAEWQSIGASVVATQWATLKLQCYDNFILLFHTTTNSLCQLHSLKVQKQPIIMKLRNKMYKLHDHMSVPYKLNTVIQVCLQKIKLVKQDPNT